MGDHSATELAEAEKEIVAEHQLREKVTNEEFKIWKKTVPLLYDTIHTHAFDFPSLSLQWLPDYDVSDDKNSITVKFLFGTNTSQHSQDYLKLGSLKLPSTLAPNFSEFSKSDSIPLPTPSGPGQTNFKTVSTWKHNGEINRLRLSSDYSKVITFDNVGDIHLYDLQGESKDPIDFKYHKLEGYSLEWVGNQRFLSGSNDSQIALWDISKPSTPIQGFKSHNAVINDLSFSEKLPNLFGSVADDYLTQIHDFRVAVNTNPAISQKSSHIQNSIAFNPDVSSLFATGGKDNIISLFDLRKPSVPFRKLFGHSDSVIGIKWNQNDPLNLVTWSLDKHVISWDLSHLDEEFTYPSSESSENSRKKNTKSVDPCLDFIHGGHTNRVNDVDIHPKIKGLIASSGDDNLIEVWKKKTILVETDEEEAENDDNQAEEGSDSANANQTKGPAGHSNSDEEKTDA
ncbi:Piso0_003142 [Millerozyma farinosa CBS 7064]|uniref:Piso0_003142 protein n=1 Tax=Pichia sorbitophila (strain ATCC MYA-4447 / BCRC 22081 / CBS 7064 / NBRC 10061 / NRRL Y-12695) TaxID=559304 RepID=G8YKG5_PICSO|nr:Piso0_003142 [Millerozyma farinosa CBS 7064]CCE80810.1 Piso0_003142 [Millerozyma farinosa CBS 7064]